MSALRAAARAFAGTALLGAGVLGYALVEARMPVLRRVDVPVLAPGEEPLTILHLSDLHLTDRTEARVKWVRALAGLHPDVVVNTGDSLSLASGMEPLRRALEPLLELPGAFVMGDHDYRATTFKLPTRYLRADPRTADDPRAETRVTELPWREVRDLQTSGGWADLCNARGAIAVRGRRIDLVGVDDPHAERDDYPAPPAESEASAESAESAPPSDLSTTPETAASQTPEGPREPTSRDGAAPSRAANDRNDRAVRDRAGRPLRIGLTHAPYRRILTRMSAEGVDLALAGHTHGGQLCVPGFGALVTNCDLDRSRASGLSQWPGRPGAPRAAGPMYLHVSAGLGTSPYTPVRIACRPEATLLTLVPSA